ncbi:error-prone DNA polymerase [Paraferrimonas sedimenticola]|uniref:Error-prone DNA polymerase n=1 Tax=Paraferrimonas sedimenticola TaxID=375674 RepID=A0AA37RX02_9GAMM|nr:error-prone DNA polymerase [Paraferrimonas sedimenticola]GLP96172.1 error-prone DNA polymerase [Paraferrimonas sedimenticola]
MYAELHCISNFSFLRGASQPQDLVRRAAELNYQAIAITDECSLAGIVRAWEAAKECGIKLIVGSEFQLAEGCLVLLARNRKGYGQLSSLISLGRVRSEKGNYQLSLSDFEHKLSDCLLLWRPAQELAEPEAVLRQLKRWFGERLYLLMERQLQSGDKRRLQRLSQMAADCRVACVAAGDVHMHHNQCQPLQDVLTCIRHGTSIDLAGSLLHPNRERYLKSLSALAKRFPQDWLETSVSIANQCNFELGDLRYEYPSELVPEGMNASQYLTQETWKGYQRRFPNGADPSVRQLICKELKLVIEMGYEYFFLTIYDLVQFAKSRHILHQGRGSAANSVVCYCLGITEVDPTQVNLLFERFISKERNEPPDIDVDFEHQRREEVIQYLYQKYGRERAALAATVISYRFKSAMRDVGKALGLDEQWLERLLKGVDRRDKDSRWQDQLQALGVSEQSDRARHLIPLVEQILGFPRHLSQHVGGFVISRGPLSELVPIENAAMADRTVIQWDKDDLEALGLLKVDVLALGMLSAIRRTFDLLSDFHGKHFGMDTVEREQAEVYRMLQKGDSVGVFQIESRAQTNMLPRLKPACYYDLVIQIAIVRPGPIQGDMVHPYLRRRKGLEAVTYPSVEVQGVLERTLGVPIFQEQVIKLAMVAAGFSAGEADQLRRAMASWKRNGRLEQFERKLLKGMAQKGYSERFARQLYQQILGFGGYGFPESHSASFALLAYVSAYLKYHHPAAFCCGLLNSQPMGFYTPSQLLQDAQRHGVEVRPVDINQSDWDHSLEPNNHNQACIRLGFRIVKGLSQAAVEQLLQARPEQGFTRTEQVLELGLKRNELAALTASDALKPLAGHRHQARWEMAAYQPDLPLFAEEHSQVAEAKPRQALSGGVELKQESSAQAMFSDYAHLGLTLGEHPMSLLRQLNRLKGCYRSDELAQCRNNQLVTVAGLVVGRQRPGTASGVTFVTLEDEVGNVNVIVWAATAKAQRVPFLTAKVLKVRGHLETAEGVIHLVAGQLIDISHECDALELSSRDFR